jgi:hypothetical protein
MLQLAQRQVGLPALLGGEVAKEARHLSSVIAALPQDRSKIAQLNPKKSTKISAARICNQATTS